MNLIFLPWKTSQFFFFHLQSSRSLFFQNCLWHACMHEGMNEFSTLIVTITFPDCLFSNFTFKCAVQKISWNLCILSVQYKQSKKTGTIGLSKCLLAEQMDEILLPMVLLGWGCRKATWGICFSSHNDRKDYEVENHPAGEEEMWGLGGVSPMPEAAIKAR